MSETILSILIVVALAIGSCSHALSQTNTNLDLDPTCLQRQWYFFYETTLAGDGGYQEFVFSQDRRYTFIESFGEIRDAKYILTGDTLTVESAYMSKAKVLACSCERLLLVLLETADELDTLVLKPYDMSYWIVNRYRLPKDGERYTQGIDDLFGRSFAMKLKEGIIRFEDLDTTGNSEVLEHFDEIAPVLDPN